MQAQLFTTESIKTVENVHSIRNLKNQYKIFLDDINISNFNAWKEGNKLYTLNANLIIL